MPTWRYIVKIGCDTSKEISLQRRYLLYSVLPVRFETAYIRILNWALCGPREFCKQQKNDREGLFELFNDPIWPDRFEEY
jgi:hypothetical protein